MSDQELFNKKRELDPGQMALFNSEMVKYQKNVGLAYVLWFFLGTLGGHKFYLGKGKQGVLYLLLTIVAGISLGSGGQVIFVICAVILGVMLLIDLLTMAKQTQQVNETTEWQILERMRVPETTSKKTRCGRCNFEFSPRFGSTGRTNCPECGNEIKENDAQYV